MSVSDAFDSLSAHHVHLWHASLQLSVTEEAEFFDLLSPEEAERALRFRFPQHKQYFIAAHAYLRFLLGQYLQLAPKAIVFDYHPKGKPYLAGSDLEFNLSHSHDKAVFAFTRSHSIGVDIEKIESTYDAAVVKRFFSIEEQEALTSLPDNLRTSAFYAIWSRKEALIKALGEGLSFSLSGFTVPAMSPALERHMAFAESQAWHLQSFEVDPSFQAAFATKQAVKQVILHADLRPRYLAYNWNQDKI